MKRCAEGAVHRLREITLEVVWHNPANSELNRKSAYAVVDTGATRSCISEQLARELNLQPSGPRTTAIGIGGPQLVNTYDVGLLIHGIGHLGGMQVFGIPDQGEVDALLGMDILSRGTFQFNDEQRFYFCVERPQHA